MKNKKIKKDIKKVKATKLSALLQTMPLDVIEEGDLEDQIKIPRNKAVGLEQVEPKKVKIYKHKYMRGDKGSDEEVVPRSKKDDGLGGKFVEFEKEIANELTTNDPDNYVQKLNPLPKPEKSKHNAEVKKLLKRIAQLENAIKKAKKELLKEKMLRKRERYAREIVAIEVAKGFYKPANRKAFEIKVASYCKFPTYMLKNDLMRVLSLPSINEQNSNNIKTASVSGNKNEFKNSFGLQTGAAFLDLNREMPNFENMRSLYLRTALSNLSPENSDSVKFLSDEIQKFTTLGNLYSENNSEEKLETK